MQSVHQTEPSPEGNWEEVVVRIEAVDDDSASQLAKQTGRSREHEYVVGSPEKHLLKWTFAGLERIIAGKTEELMSTELDSYMLPHVERIKALAGNRIASVTPHDDCYEITFRSNPTDDYGFEAWVYRDERALQIGARLQGEPTYPWYRPFERAGFSNEDDQWTAFARLLSDLFEKSSRIEIRAGWLFVDSGCFLEGEDRPIYVVAQLYLIKEARQLARMSPKTWHSGPIPSD